MARLGIDLGTWSVSALLVDATSRQLVPDPDTGQLWTRSAIARGPQGGWLIGRAAEQIRDIHPQLCRDDLKRLLDSDHPAYLGGAPYQISELLTQIINRSLAHARELTRESIDYLVIGVPVAFEGTRADTLRTAAAQAGFPRERVTLELEPVAAARAALDNTSEAGTWLVFDLGGGTFDAALVRTDDARRLTIVDTAGDATIGGYLIDEAITNHLRKSHNLPEPTDDKLWEATELTQAARVLKHQLTDAPVGYARNPYCTGPKQLTLTRDQLTALATPTIDAAIDCAEILLRANHMSWRDLGAIIPTGGATRSPAVLDRLADHASIHRSPHPPEINTTHGLVPSRAGVSAPSSITLTSTGTSTPHPMGAATPITPTRLTSITCLRTLTGHASAVQSAVFSPNCALLATASTDQTVRVWDSTTGEHRHTLTGHTDGTWRVAFSPNGALLATTGDQTVRIWEPYTGTHRYTFAGHRSYVHGVAFSFDGILLATTSSDGNIRIWDLHSGAVVQILACGSGLLHDVAFSPDGALLAAHENSGIVRIWNPLTGASIRTLTGHTHWVENLAFSPDGTLLATTSPDTTTRIWDPATGAHRHTLIGHSDWIRGIAFSPDGALLATSSWDKTVRIWDPTTGEHRHTITGHPEGVNGVAFSPDGVFLATASGDGAIRIWGVRP